LKRIVAKESSAKATARALDRADDMSVEVVDSGHSMVEECPQFVLERALAFFGPVQGLD
jgi:hypothetical protein